MIEAYTGLPGQGKTYLMTRMALKKMKKGRTVYANYPLEGSIRFNQVHEVFDVTNAIILLDEAGLVAPAAHWKSIPFEVMAHWRTHRHNGVDLYYTAQDLQDVAVPLRRVTQFVNEVSKFGMFIKWRTYMPRNKAKYGGGLHIFDQTIADKYNSFDKTLEKQDYIK